MIHQSQFFGKIADAVTGCLNQTVFTGDKTEKQSHFKIGQPLSNVLESQFIHSSASWTIQPHFVRQD